MGAGRIYWGQVLAVLSVLMLGAAFATQWTAAHLGFQPALGAPDTFLFGVPIYAPWRFFISAFVIGLVIAAAVFFAAHLGTLPLWAQITYLVLAVLSPVAWTALALQIGASLRRAGVARRS